MKKGLSLPMSVVVIIVVLLVVLIFVSIFFTGSFDSSSGAMDEYRQWGSDCSIIKANDCPTSALGTVSTSCTNNWDACKSFCCG